MKRLIAVVATALLSACASTAEYAQLKGEVFYLQRIALPENATLSVSLLDVSLADAPAKVLAQQNGPIKGQVPLPFELSYDPAQLKDGHRYAVSARIEANGQLLWLTTDHQGVQLDGSDPQLLKLRLNPAR